MRQVLLDVVRLGLSTSSGRHNNRAFAALADKPQLLTRTVDVETDDNARVVRFGLNGSSREARDIAVAINGAGGHCRFAMTEGPVLWFDCE